MTILEVLLLLALIVGAVYHWMVRDSLKCRIGDLEWDLGNLKFASSRQTNAYGQLIAESKQLERDLEQYKTAAYEWETRFNVSKEDANVLIERIRKAKAALQ